MSKALKAKGFRFVGPTICYAFMQSAGMVNDHHPDCWRYSDCQKLLKGGHNIRTNLTCTDVQRPTVELTFACWRICLATFFRWSFWLLSFIPPHCAVAIGRGVARVMIFFNADSHRISKINIDHCLPQKSAPEREQISLPLLAQTRCYLIEFAHLLHRPIEELMGQIVSVEGEDLLRDAWAEGNGVLMLMPHFGCWEFMSLYLGSDYTVSALYTPPNLASLEPTILQARERQGATLFPTSAAGLRGLVRGMKAWSCCGTAPGPSAHRRGRWRDE